MPLSHYSRGFARASGHASLKQTQNATYRHIRLSSSEATPEKDKSKAKDDSQPKSKTQPTVTSKKTQAELDKELELKMQGLAGDGGEAGLELEDGQPVSMKRSVKNNMFRYI